MAKKYSVMIKNALWDIKFQSHIDTLEVGQAKIDSLANTFVLDKRYYWNKPVGTNVAQ